jgi:molybdopterin-guanine dinucleotide biosynthesis protein A
VSGRPDGPEVSWTGVVLAGGRSQRFGGVDKTRLPLGGRTLLQRAVDALAPLTATCFVVGGAPVSGARTVPDRYPGAGPLGGLLTALATIDSSHALILAADLPFISGSLLRDVQRAGADAAAAVVEHPDGRLALCLSVRRGCAPVVLEMWSRGARRMRDLEALVPYTKVVVDVTIAPGALWNVNDPLTYARALELTEHDCPAC